MLRHGLSALVLLATAVSVTGCAGGSDEDDGSPKKIFVSSQLTNGDLRTIGNGITGIMGADAICQNEANGNGVFRTVKAMIVDDIRRRACSTAGCAGGTAEQLDWVLKADRAYARADGTVIGTTNAKGLFVFPLTNAISTAGGNVLTGFSSNADWTSDIAKNCQNWENSGGGLNATIGSNTSTGSSILQNGNRACNLGLVRIYCVEQ